MCFVYLFLHFFFCLFRATPAAHGGSQARSLIGAVAAGLRQSLSNSGSVELHHSSRQCRILNLLSEARGRTCNFMVPSRIC